MNLKIRTHLIKVAQARRTCTYSELNIECQLGLDFNRDIDRARVGDLLGDVAEYEYRQGRPILSAVCVHAQDSDVGDGFYRICEHLKIGEAKQLKRDFYGFAEMRRCHEFWANPQNHSRFAEVLP